ncbi:hypothetical protein Tco_1124693 [Tanacetum coccineum]|uniref:Uncharacterized protein n=1 Tax=Tanacetum coccineum TaxID=301880 RepID=A0ABQ5J9R3_9ASTR
MVVKGDNGGDCGGGAMSLLGLCGAVVISGVVVSVVVIGCAVMRGFKTRFIDGSCVNSAYANSEPLSNQWERCNSIVLSWLLNYVSEGLFLGQIFSDNPVEVWVELKSRLLSKEALPDVKDAFAIISREEYHRGITFSSSGYVSKPRVSSFVAKTNNWSYNGNKMFENKKYSNCGLTTKQINGAGSENGGLYFMLGHPSDQVVDVLQSELNFTKDSHVSPYEICHRAK